MRSPGTFRHRHAAARAALVPPSAGVADWVFAAPATGASRTSPVPGPAPAETPDKSGWLTLMGDADWESLN